MRGAVPDRRDWRFGLEAQAPGSKSVERLRVLLFDQSGS